MSKCKCLFFITALLSCNFAMFHSVKADGEGHSSRALKIATRELIGSQASPHPHKKEGAEEQNTAPPIADDEAYKDSAEVQRGQISTDGHDGASNNGITILTVDGLGSDVESASKNAAENALKQVLGSFVQTDAMLAKRVEILNGIRSETKSLHSSTREYSQGTIASFDLLSSESKSGFVAVRARVAVRRNDFRGFVSRVIDGKGIIDGGLFGEVRARRSQKQNLEDIIMESIINPVNTGQVMDIVVGKAIPFEESIFPAFVSSKAQSGPSHFEELQARIRLRSAMQELQGLGLLRQSKTESAYVFPVRIKLRTDFVRNMLNTLQSVGTRATSREAGYSGWGSGSVISYLSLPAEPFGETYRSKFFPQGSWRISTDLRFGWCSIRLPRVTIYGENDFIVFNRAASDRCAKNKIGLERESIFLTIPKEGSFRVPGSLLQGQLPGGLFISSEDEFYFIVKLSDDQIKMSRRIEFSYGDE